MEDVEKLLTKSISIKNGVKLLKTFLEKLPSLYHQNPQDQVLLAIIQKIKKYIEW